MLGDRVQQSAPVLQELVSDVHCIIDAMIGKESGVGLLCPCTEGVPDVVLVRLSVRLSCCQACAAKRASLRPQHAGIWLFRM